ncbi:TPA: glycosyltransferase [Klebsiella variicola]|nr:glycosyltransferase [Klebsiella variicola]HDG8026424.1 glycosyltransferase [Klebsiella variicola]
MTAERKIAIYNLNTYPEMSGGSERSCLELAKELIKLGEDVRVVSLNPFLNGVKVLEYEGVRIEKIPLLNIYWPTGKKKKSFIAKVVWNIIDIANIPMSLYLAIYLKKNRINLVHTNNIKGVSPTIFPIMRWFGIKTVHTTRDYYLLDNGAWYRDIQSQHNTMVLRARRALKKILSSSADFIVYNSKYMKEYHESCCFFNHKRNQVIYNGFDPSVYKSNEKQNDNVKYTFGFIGRVTEEKGLDLLVNGFLEFNNDEFNLVIAGSTLEEYLSLYPEKEKEIRRRTDISFLGVVDNKFFYNKVDCVVVPSRYNEPFGRVAMEAIFMGKSVIVSDRGGLPEQIINGVHGVVCGDNNYAKAMQKIFLTHTDKALNLDIDLNKFTINYCAQAYLEVYKEALNGQK